MSYCAYLSKFLKYILLSYLCLQLANVLHAQPQAYRFNRIGKDSKLSNTRVTAIIRDEQNFLWFGTASGLNRYDGFRFKVFTHDEADGTSINENYIDKLIIGPSKALWAYTPNGWNKYNQQKEQFSSNPQDYLRAIGVPHQWFKTIVRGINDDYWFIYPEEGIYVFHEKSGKTEHIHADQKNNPLFSNHVSSVSFDRRGFLWIVYIEGRRNVGTRKI